jgi:glycine cleavage system H protein
MKSVIPEDLRYSETHEWVRESSGIATIGITDHAQQELTEIVYVGLPQLGKTLKPGEAFSEVDSVKTASEVNSPISGEIIEVNKELQTNPGLVNNDPYGAGWFIKIKITDPSELSKLMDAKRYAEFIGEHH